MDAVSSTTSLEMAAARLHGTAHMLKTLFPRREDVEMDGFAAYVHHLLSVDYTTPLWLRDSFYPCQQDFIDHIYQAEVEFVPGLLHHFVTGVFPSAQFFLHNSLDLKKGFGVYVLVLGKWEYENSERVITYRLYGGSGTNVTSGLPSRMSNYDNLTSLSVGVKAAIADGYIIMHKSIIAWCPMPEIAIHVSQILVLTIEAAISQAFGLHRPSQTTSLERCLWNLADLDFTGLCTSSSLFEVHRHASKLNLTLEELEHLAAEMKSAPKRNHARYEKTEKGKATKKRYDASEKGRAAILRKQAKVNEGRAVLRNEDPKWHEEQKEKKRQAAKIFRDEEKRKAEENPNYVSRIAARKQREKEKNAKRRVEDPEWAAQQREKSKLNTRKVRARKRIAQATNEEEGGMEDAEQ